ncbi:MAG: ribosome maturation factor RimP [Thermoleophilaceae bacterium]
MTNHTDEIHTAVEARLARSLPDVDLLACEQIGAERLRVTIDHPDGVDLALCERVTHELGDLLTRYGLEVSSPGPERPLVKPDHFRRFLGRRARVRTREPRDGHRSFTGELVGASEAEVTVAAGTGVVTIPYAEIARSHLVSGTPDAEGGRTDDMGNGGN